MWLAIVLGAVVAAALLRAWWMDRQAAKQGKRWVPVREGRMRRTRFELVDRDHYDEHVRQRALEQALADRDRRRTEEQGYLMPRLPRLPRRPRRPGTRRLRDRG